MIEFILTSLAIGFLIALPACLIELGLMKAGIVRNTMGDLIVCILAIVFAKRIWFDEVSWTVYAPIVIFIGILGVNRFELNAVISKGTWWWQSSPSDGFYTISLTTLAIIVGLEILIAGVLWWLIGGA